MIKNIVVLFSVAFLFVSCSVKTPAPKKVQISPSTKVFPEEDMYIMFALDAQRVKDYDTASTLFENLYEKSAKKEYLYKYLENSLLAGENQRVLKKIEEITHGSLSDTHLVRLKVVAFAESRRIFEATTLALKLLEIQNTEENYLLLANLYLQQGEYDLSLKYLESAYNKSSSEEILNKMAIILYSNLHRSKDAIALLETHINEHGCSLLICNRLLGIYSNENNVNGLLSTYLKLYKFKPTPEIAEKIIQIYEYKKDAKDLIVFLEKSKIDDKKLLQLYAFKGKYKKAYILSDNLYMESGDIYFLGQSAMYEYNAAGKTVSTKIVKNVIEKLKKVIKVDSSPLYLNTLGYIMIEHKIDIKQGMNYVRKALKAQPDSVYYIDSLAWGYYNLGECTKAEKLMKKITPFVKASVELIEHKEAIEKCKTNNKGRK